MVNWIRKSTSNKHANQLTDLNKLTRHGVCIRRLTGLWWHWTCRAWILQHSASELWDSNSINVPKDLAWLLRYRSRNPQISDDSSENWVSDFNHLALHYDILCIVGIMACILTNWNHVSPEKRGQTDTLSNPRRIKYLRSKSESRDLGTHVAIAPVTQRQPKRRAVAGSRNLGLGRPVRGGPGTLVSAHSK